MRNETITAGTGRVGLAAAFGNLARQGMPFAAAASCVGETGPGSLSSRAAEVYAGRAASRPRHRPEPEPRPGRS